MVSAIVDLAGEIDGDGVLGLHIVEAGEDQAQNLLSVGTHLGDGLGGAAGAGSRECRSGQVPFLSLHHRPARSRGTTKIGTAG